MTKLASDTKNFIVPITALPIEQTENNEVFQALLNGIEFVTIGHQILFEQEGQYYLSRIDNEYSTLLKMRTVPFPPLCGEKGVKFGGETQLRRSSRYTS